MNKRYIRKNLAIFIFLVISSLNVGYVIYAANGSATKNAASTIQNLTKYEIDNFFLIRQCYENVDKPGLIKNDLSLMSEDCERNIRELSDLALRYKVQPPVFKKDYTGFLMEGYAAIRAGLGEAGALKALHTTNTYILKQYRNALDKNLPVEVKDIIGRICETKKRHLQILEGHINARN